MENKLYEAVLNLNIKRVELLIEGGCTPDMINGYLGDEGRNLVMKMLDDGWNILALDIIDMLIDKGLDIYHRDDNGVTLLTYLIELIDWDFKDEIKGKKVKNKFELRDVIRVKQTFDKLMKLNPDLENNNSLSVFQIAIKARCSFWFEPYLEVMEEENKQLFASYRLARLFE